MTTIQDLDILARTIYGEARGEWVEIEGGLSSLIAIGNVVINRLRRKTWFGSTLQQVCQKPQQFSCWNPSDPNFLKLLRAEEEGEIFKVCQTVAKGVATQNWPDITRNSDHYYAQSLKIQPFWAHGKTPVLKLGHHLFFKLTKED